MTLTPGLDVFASDVRFAARVFRRKPGFALITILTLALGLGAATAIFSVVNAVLLRPLPWSNPDRAVMIFSRWTAFDKTWVASGDVVDYRRRTTTLEGVAAWTDGEVNLTGEGDPERIPAGYVSANTFSILGVSPIRGRIFTANEDLPNGAHVALIGYALWQRRYAGDPAIIGRPIEIDGSPYEVVGILPSDFVLPTDFENPSPTKIWMPLQLDPASTEHGSHGYFAAGRLRAGFSVEQAAADLHRVAREMTAAGFYPPQMQFDTVVLSLRDETVGGARRAIWLLFGAVIFLLLIACVNIANLLLARAEERRHELALRAALGAGRSRVLRQLLTEGLVLSFIGALGGLAIAWLGVRALTWWTPAGIPRLAEAGIDARVLAFALTMAVVTAMLFSLAPALHTMRAALSNSLKDRSFGSSSGSHRRVGQALMVAEIALAIVLLVGAGQMLRSLWWLQRVDLGFRPAGVLTMKLALPEASYQSPEQVVSFYRRLLERVRELPGVTAAGAARALPLASQIGDFGLLVDGYVPPLGTHAKGDWEIVTDGYLESIGEQLLRGRTFLSSDTADSQLVGLVNEEMARRYWPGRDPLGGRFKVGMSPQRPWVTVVGVVKNVRHNGVTAAIKEKFYIPHSQWNRDTGYAIRAMSLVVRDGSRPEGLTTAVRESIREIDPSLPVSDVRPMTAVVESALSTPTFTSMLLGLFAALALTLAVVGIYGVLSYVVSRRTREIGVRLAIGADRGRVLRMVLGEALRVSIAGIVTGTLVAIPVVNLMRGLLHGVSPEDPLVFGLAACGLIGVASVAAAVPALRAMRVDPVVALRTE